MKKSDLVALAETMISTSFSALHGMRLKLETLDSDEYVMAVWLEGKEIHLDVSREDMARMGRSVVTGVLAHELCHAEADARRGPLLTVFLDWLCERIPSLETRMERRIDIAAIQKGYGNELLAFQRYHDQHYEAYDKTDGLTIEEIEEALLYSIPRDRTAEKKLFEHGAAGNGQAAVQDRGSLARRALKALARTPSKIVGIKDRAKRARRR